ncbi:hypothetical protein NEMBOFW57_003053 [Staphylotrichum longicolle]|uniref:Ankyrin repeat protein n=1 Tax=Staphylotrichum longicolle TaxID=669026 RepID=A0AAD4F3Z6_9PEZI|nr:hypothetical protein NEMBOFW57_003053 [Staphylotrichum longicolle]
MNLAIELETVSASSSQRRFSLKPVILEGKPRITISATAALQTLGATEMLKDLDRISSHSLAKVRALQNDMWNVGQTVAQAKARLDKVRAEIEALKLEELRAAEEYDRAREQEVEVRDSRKRVKRGYFSIRRRIETMDEFLGIYNSGAEGPEKEVALSEVAAQVLPFAILDKYDSFARLLIDQASNVTTEDHEGFTPLDHAVLRGQEELVQLLIDKAVSSTSSAYFLREAPIPHRRTLGE